jgi:hypothetical protein
MFYPGARNWDKLQELAEGKFGKDDPFPLLVAEIKPALLMVLNLRIALSIKVTDMIPAALIWLYDNRVCRPEAGGMACCRCARRPRQIGGNSGGLIARWIATWSVRSLVHLVPMVTADNRAHS